MNIFKFIFNLLMGLGVEFLWYANLKLRDTLGAATNRESTIYTNRYTNKYLNDARNYSGRVVPIYFELTVVSASAASDTYDLFQIPANWSVAMLFGRTEAMGASAGSSVDMIIGDSGDDDRLVKATDADAAEASFNLAFSGIGYRPTADTIEEAKFDAAPVVGKIVKGHVFLVTPA